MEKTMKKRFLSLISAVVALVMCAVALSGCKLVTKNSEREMNTVVATVKIDDTVERESILKKDLIMAYLSYGYYYVQYQGMTQAQTFKLILENLISNRILVQKAMSDAGKKSVTDCLDADQLVSAKYSAYKSINDMLDEYAHNSEGHDHENDHAKGDTLTLTARTVPTGATNAEKELDIAAKKSYVEELDKNGFDTDSTAERRSAFTKIIKLLKNNGLIGDKFDGKDLKTTAYYENLYKSYCESEVLTAFDKKVADEARKVTMAELRGEYAKKLDTQKEWSNKDFVDALGNAKASDPILYGAFGSYGYVYNLLLGVNDYQKAQLDKIKQDNASISDDDYSAERKDILSGITVKDQRASWILSGYDCEYLSEKQTVKFTGDYSFASAANALEFQGTVKLLKEKTDDDAAEYSVTDVKTFGLNEFIEFMDNYLYGAKQTGDAGVTDVNVLKQVTKAAGAAEYAEKINDLLFAFSTDSGSLNTWKGYAVKPVPDGSNTEEYVQSFADAARQLLTLGGNSYIVVATDYGYHVMFYSELINKDFKYDTLDEYLDSLNLDKAEYDADNWDKYLENMLNKWDDVKDTDNFLYSFVNSLTSAKVSSAQTKTRESAIKAYRYDETKVSVLESNYKDLLG